MNKNFKSCGLELKDLDDSKGIVSFYFSSFGNEDSDGDILQKGAFTKSIKENLSLIKHFKNHYHKLALGKILELCEDEK